jgi:acetyl esterase
MSLFVSEFAVACDEGEACARKLAEAGVPVTASCYLGTILDFVMLNALAKTPAARAQATWVLRQAFSSKP